MQIKKPVKEIIKYIKKYNKIALFHHINIDGDSFSSSYGLALAIKKIFPEKQITWFANIEEFEKNFPMLSVDKTYLSHEIDDSWLAIVGDTSSKSRLEYIDEIEKAGAVVVFDHHRNDIEIKHDFFWHEKEYPASAMQAIEIAYGLNVDFDEEIAFALMIGLLTDTGNFTYSLGNELPVLMFGNLLKYISNEKMDKFWNAFRQKSLKDLEIKKMFLNHLKFSGKVAYVYLDLKQAEKFKDVNFKISINEIANIQGYPIWCLFVEEKVAGTYLLKLHFRSNGPDVSKVAIKYNGGGHKRAAGAKIPLLDGKLDEILAELNQKN